MKVIGRGLEKIIRYQLMICSSVSCQAREPLILFSSCDKLLPTHFSLRHGKSLILQPHIHLGRQDDIYNVYYLLLWMQ